MLSYTIQRNHAPGNLREKQFPCTLNAMFIRREMNQNRVARCGVIKSMYTQLHQKFSG